MTVLVSERENWKTGSQAEMEEEGVIRVDVSHVRRSLDFYLTSVGTSVYGSGAQSRGH